jgi:ubiquinone/menaquinone biosynthesis C-methylase UbiE
LLGNLQGKTIVDLGCGEGVNTAILARLGARVLSVDTSGVSLELTGRRAAANRVAANVTLLHSDAAGIPVRDAVADHVLCTSVLHQLNPILTARQVRRILRPGGTAVFKAPLALPLLATMKTLLADGEAVLTAQRALKLDEIEAVSRAVGHPGRWRAFWLTTRLLWRMGLARGAVTRASQKLDASILRRFPSSCRFASPLVWEACKES